MDWMDWARGVFGLIATLALIAGAALLARRLGLLSARPPGRARRLSVQESLMLDPRRRLVLVRLDDRDHLLLLSATGDISLTATAAPIAPRSEEAGAAEGAP